jgi:cytochrome bd-type quinol oxidase subunit 1
MKMAAAEALWTSEDPASFSLLTVGDLSQRREVFSIRLPGLLSLLAFNQVYGQVKGIFDLQAEYVRTYGPGDYIPPVALVYWSFRVMVGAGVLLLLLALYALFLVMGEVYEQRPGIMKILRCHHLLTSQTQPADHDRSGRVLIVFGLTHRTNCFIGYFSRNGANPQLLTVWRLMVIDVTCW